MAAVKGGGENKAKEPQWIMTTELNEARDAVWMMWVRNGFLENGEGIQR